MNEVSLHCTECPFKTNSSRKLGRHTALAHANWKYRCPLCPFDSCYVASLYRHKKEVHQIGLNNQTDLQNFECSDEDEDQNGIDISSHSDDKTFTMSLPKMNRPRRTSSRGSRGSSGSVTPQSSSDTPDLAKDLLPCRIQRRYKCTTCDLQTRNPRDYLYHLRDVHGEKLKVYECSQCLYASRHQQKLQRHENYGHSARARKLLPLSLVQTKHPVARKTMTQPTEYSITEPLSPPEVKEEVAENEYDHHYDTADVDYGVSYQSDGYPEMFPPEAQDYHVNNLAYENAGVNNYMENLYNVQMLEEPPEEEILEIIDGEVDEVMNMSAQDIGSPNGGSPTVQSPVMWKPEEVVVTPQAVITNSHKCSKCPFTSKSKMLVQRHEKVKHVKRKSYRCVKCSYVTNILGRYTKHMKYHDLPYIKCDMCDFKTPYRWNIDRHMKNHTTDGILRCNLCSFATDTKQSLSFHTFNHHIDPTSATQPNASNVDCDRKTVLYSEVNGTPTIISYTKVPLPHEELEDTTSSVPENGKRRAPYVNLRAVAVKKGKFKRRFRCHQCSFVANSRSSLYRHKVQHKNAAAVEEVKPIERNDTPGYMNLANVIQQEGAEKPLKCKLCAYEAKWISEMVKHQRIHTHEKPFICPFCGFRSRWKGDMNRHVQKYHTESKKTENAYSRPFLTTRKRRRLEEQEAFDRERNQSVMELDGVRNQPPRVRKRALGDINESSQQHTERKRNNSDANLVNTINVDSNVGAVKKLDSESAASQEEQEKPVTTSLRVLRRYYRCPHCKFTASTASRFHVHVVAHFNKRPFMCSECGYRSNWQWDVTKHIRLKIARQQTHYDAKLETLNEFGNRNYEKYIKYVVYDDSPITDDNHGDAVDGLETGESTMKLRPSYWKCKQCSYKSQKKRLILQHLPTHCPDRPFFCGECGQASRWRENVERHCRLQHGNIIRMIENRDVARAMATDGVKVYDDMTDKDGFVRDASSTKDSSGMVLKEDAILDAKMEPATVPTMKGTDPDSQPLKRHACKICPYRTRKIYDMELHMTMHKPQPGTIFKCMFCPFYTSLRRSLLQHMKLHVSKPHEYINNALESTEDQDDEINVANIVENVNSVSSQSGVVQALLTSANQMPELQTSDAIEPAICISEGDQTLVSTSTKRYQCDHCPYTSDSRTQYLYHKQFHRNSRGCHFKCPHCTYAVTKCHLLNQHIRLHTAAAQAQVPNKLGTAVVASSSVTKDSITIHSNVPFQRKTGIPMVWVSKGTTNMVKMYKCRYCPHVNKRRSNIREHEKMHRKRRMTGRFFCTFCTYVCNNQGVLSTHIKVHQNTSQVTDSAVATQPPDSTSALNILPSEVNETVYLPPLNKPTGTEQVQKVLYKCDICPERFTRPGDLRIHGKFHVADLPWKCTHCTYSAKHRSQLYRHMKVHAPNYIGRSSSAEVTSEEANNQPLTEGAKPTSPRVSSPVKASPIKSHVKAPPSENKHRCHLCPANFLKPSNLAYHLSLHGGTGRFKCPHCSYAVKNIGNLCRHTKVHDKARMKGIVAQPTDTSTTPSATISSQRDLSRRLACNKCPATFTKQLRYDIHVKLHGSNQRFVCEYCDYSVPFMANLLKHQKIHTLIDNAVKELAMPSSAEEAADTKIASAESSPKKAAQQNLQDLSLSEQQMLMLLQHQQQMAQQLQQGADAKRYFFCDYCPYQHPRKDAVISHMKRHDAAQEMVCPHCDYGTSTHSHAFIREHIKLHFHKPKGYRIQSYWKCEQPEVWAAESCGTSTLIFKDKGDEVDTMNRFYTVGCETEPFIEELVPGMVDSKSQVAICDIENQNMDLDVTSSTTETFATNNENVKPFEARSMIVDDTLHDKLDCILVKSEDTESGIVLTNVDDSQIVKCNEEEQASSKTNYQIVTPHEDNSMTSHKSDANYDSNYKSLPEPLWHKEPDISKPQTTLTTFQICADAIDTIIAEIERDELDRTLILDEVDPTDLESEESSTKDAKDSVTTVGDASSIELVLEESSTESLEEMRTEMQDDTLSMPIQESAELMMLERNTDIAKPSTEELSTEMQDDTLSVSVQELLEIKVVDRSSDIVEPAIESTEDRCKEAQDDTVSVPVSESSEMKVIIQSSDSVAPATESIEDICTKMQDDTVSVSAYESSSQMKVIIQSADIVEPATESIEETCAEKQDNIASVPVSKSSEVKLFIQSSDGVDGVKPATESIEVMCTETQDDTLSVPARESSEMKVFIQSSDIVKPAIESVEDMCTETQDDDTLSVPARESSEMKVFIQSSDIVKPAIESVEDMCTEMQDDTLSVPARESSEMKVFIQSSDSVKPATESIEDMCTKTQNDTVSVSALESSSQMKVLNIQSLDIVEPATESIEEMQHDSVSVPVRESSEMKMIIQSSNIVKPVTEIIEGMCTVMQDDIVSVPACESPEMKVFTQSSDNVKPATESTEDMCTEIQGKTARESSEMKVFIQSSDNLKPPIEGIKEMCTQTQDNTLNILVEKSLELKMLDNSSEIAEPSFESLEEMCVETQDHMFSLPLQESTRKEFCSSVDIVDKQFSTSHTKDNFNMKPEQDSPLVKFNEFNAESTEVEEEVGVMNSENYSSVEFPAMPRLDTLTAATSNDLTNQDKNKYEENASDCPSAIINDVECAGNKLEIPKDLIVDKATLLQLPVNVNTTKEACSSTVIFAELEAVVETSFSDLPVSVDSSHVATNGENPLHFDADSGEDLPVGEVSSETLLVSEWTTISVETKPNVDIISKTHDYAATEVELTNEICAANRSKVPYIEETESNRGPISVADNIVMQTGDDSKTESNMVMEREELSLNDYLPESAATEIKSVYTDSAVPDDVCCEIITMNDESQLHIEIIGQ